jgi:hypothetical protein
VAQKGYLECFKYIHEQGNHWLYRYQIYERVPQNKQKEFEEYLDKCPKCGIPKW